MENEKLSEEGNVFIIQYLVSQQTAVTCSPTVSH